MNNSQTTVHQNPPRNRINGRRKNMTQNKLTQGIVYGSSSQMEQEPFPNNNQAVSFQQSQVERLAVIGQTMAVFCHECRNELVSIKFGLEILENSRPMETQDSEVIRHMKNSELRLERLFNDIREYAASIRLNLAEHHISEIWRGAWESLRTVRAKRDVSLSELGDGIDISIRIDKFRLEQVFRNLFENSLAACSDPVRIELECFQETVNSHSSIHIDVRDNGPGLSSEQKQKVFEPFFTTKSNGTGLGMAITKQIVESHGGLITVGNNGVHGAAFTIILPLDCGQSYCMPGCDETSKLQVARK